ncbi:energy transducer TonB [Dyella caseinilytica]|uniref:Energy transducer TonB n=1 Tax=Dyella caseinilytica TaxID=1849581 RepID=A0ABX7H024_9GAMM|nr:energy transducer TonB [Dyella caseinilytica]
MKRWIVAVLCVTLAHAAFAAGPNQVRQRAEGSMLVTGWIDVSPDGSVHGYSLDQSDKIPAAVTDLIQKNVPDWKFKLDGNPNVIERARMSVRLVARRVDDTHDSIAIVGATFGDSNTASGQSVTHKSMQPPKYPLSAVQAHVDGTVYLYLRVGRQGQVEDAVAERVNLGVYGSDIQMRRYRDILADAALEAAKQWTFNIPTNGKHIDDPYWDVRVPVNFNLKVAGSPRVDTYGKWQVYIPGPQQSIPWLKSGLQTVPTSDAIPEGSISQVSQDLHLLTPLEGA